MSPEQKRPYKTYRVGGRSFPVYLEYDEQMEESYPAYPDFEQRPEYTDEGRPFATAGQESCPHCKPQRPGEAFAGRLWRLWLVFKGTNALRSNRYMHERCAAKKKRFQNPRIAERLYE